MSRERIKYSFDFLLTDVQKEHIRSIDVINGKVKVRIDLHGMGRNAATKLIKLVINCIYVGFELFIIHGFNHGTVLRDLVRSEVIHERVSSVVADKHNDGVTTFFVRA